MSCEHREEFRLGTRFKAEPEWLSELDDFLDDMALLVDLDGINAGVAATVVVFGDGGFESFMDLADAVLQDVGEAHEHWQADAAHDEFIDEFLEIDLLVFALGGEDGDVSVIVDAEVPLAPIPDVVDVGGILNAPRLHGLHQIHFRFLPWNNDGRPPQTEAGAGEGKYLTLFVTKCSNIISQSWRNRRIFLGRAGPGGNLLNIFATLEHKSYILGVVDRTSNRRR